MCTRDAARVSETRPGLAAHFHDESPRRDKLDSARRPSRFGGTATETWPDTGVDAVAGCAALTRAHRATARRGMLGRRPVASYTGSDNRRASVADLPRGTVTFLFTDIEGSTRLLKELRGGYGEVLADQRRLLRGVFEEHGVREIDMQGDAFFVV